MLLFARFVVHQQIDVLNDKLESATGSKDGTIHTDGSEPDSAAAWKQSVKKCKWKFEKKKREIIG